MITCRLTGGIGEQLFQIFTTLAYSITYGISLMFDYVDETTEYESSEGAKKHHTYWNTLFVNIHYLTTYSLSNNSMIDISTFFPYQEPRRDFRVLPKEISERNMKLVGKFQSYRYFDEKKKYIYKLIKLGKLKKIIQNVYGSDIGMDGAVSMHFRIHQFQRDETPILQLEYYKKAINHLMTQRNISKIIVFCHEEDNEMVEIQLNILREMFAVPFVKIDSSITDWEQLLLMSCCRDNIISNSSFSWWGAYLNEMEDKFVIFPQKYWEDQPPSWIGI